MRRILPPLTGRRVLDIGCGDGRWCRYAQAQGAAWVVGADFSAEMLRAARGGTACRALAAADMRALPFADASFDVAIHALALGHVAEPAATLREIAQVLCDGGQLALVDLHPRFAERGWTRSFRDADGQRLAVSWFPHAPAAVEAACAAAGLAVEQAVECALDEATLPPAVRPPAEAMVYGLRAVRRPR
jgi:malonyl-CoA O-methyltransferase